MEQNTKMVLVAVGLGGLGYLLYKKGYFSKTKTPVAPIEVAETRTYPMGIGKDGSTFELNEGDYVANGEETAVLYGGELRPITASYAAKYTAGTWDRTKILDNVVYRSIPRGAVLDA